ncbi:trypsin inhibitor-like [Prorops nasuta]|uniref:trypsin inhibitor-like n=1 Tax=Prorops nasuta TaxID=863751 RepID=UPI0034CDC805
MKVNIVVLLFTVVLYCFFTSHNVSAQNPVCSQPLEPGDCRGAYRRYGYDTTERKCVKFIYGGCPVPGNNNIFATLSECEKACP